MYNTDQTDFYRNTLLGMKERMQDYAFNSFVKETEAKQGKEAAERIQLGVEKVADTIPLQFFLHDVHLEKVMKWSFQKMPP